MITDIKEALAEVRYNPDKLLSVDPSIDGYKYVVIEALTKKGELIEKIDEKYKTDEAVILAAANSLDEIFEYVPDKLKNDKKFVLQIVGNNGLAIKGASERFKNDRDVLRKAIHRNVKAVPLVDEKFLRDEDFVRINIAACVRYVTYFHIYDMKRKNYTLNLDFAKHVIKYDTTMEATIELTKLYHDSPEIALEIIKKYPFMWSDYYDEGVMLNILGQVDYDKETLKKIIKKYEEYPIVVAAAIDKLNALNGIEESLDEFDDI